MLGKTCMVLELLQVVGQALVERRAPRGHAGWVALVVGHAGPGPHGQGHGAGGHAVGRGRADRHHGVARTWVMNTRRKTRVGPMPWVGRALLEGHSGRPLGGITGHAARHGHGCLDGGAGDRGGRLAGGRSPGVRGAGQRSQVGVLTPVSPCVAYRGPRLLPLHALLCHGLVTTGHSGGRTFGTSAFAVASLGRRLWPFLTSQGGSVAEDLQDASVRLRLGLDGKFWRLRKVATSSSCPSLSLLSAGT